MAYDLYDPSGFDLADTVMADEEMTAAEKARQIDFMKSQYGERTPGQVPEWLRMNVNAPGPFDLARAGYEKAGWPGGVAGAVADISPLGSGYKLIKGAGAALGAVSRGAEAVVGGAPNPLKYATDPEGYKAEADANENKPKPELGTGGVTEAEEAQKKLQEQFLSANMPAPEAGGIEYPQVPSYGQLDDTALQGTMKDTAQQLGEIQGQKQAAIQRMQSTQNLLVEEQKKLEQQEAADQADNDLEIKYAKLGLPAAELRGILDVAGGKAFKDREAEMTRLQGELQKDLLGRDELQKAYAAEQPNMKAGELVSTVSGKPSGAEKYGAELRKELSTRDATIADKFKRLEELRNQDPRKMLAEQAAAKQKLEKGSKAQWGEGIFDDGGKTIAAAIALFAGNVGEVLTRGLVKSRVWDVISTSLDRNFEQQKAAFERADAKGQKITNAYSRLYARTRDKAATKLEWERLALNELDVMSSGIKDERAQAEMAFGIQERKMRVANDNKTRRFDQAMQIANAKTRELAAGQQQGRVAVSLVQERRKANAAIQLLEAMKTAYDKTTEGGKWGERVKNLIASKYPGLASVVGADQAQLQNMVTRAMLSIPRMIGLKGAQSNWEGQVSRAMFTEGWEERGVAMDKINSLIDQIKTGTGMVDEAMKAGMSADQIDAALQQQQADYFGTGNL